MIKIVEYLKATLGGSAIISASKWYSIRDTFLYNEAKTSGGAAEGDLFLSIFLIGSTFMGNSAKNGGAIDFSFGSSLTIYNTSFTSNYATLSGGGIVIESTDSSIEHSLFEENVAQYIGGALFGYEISDETSGESVSIHYIDIDSCIFNDNRAKIAGGAINSLSFLTVTLTRSSFFRNKAAVGGAIASTDTSFLVSYTDFIENTATIGGGGLYWEYFATLKQVH